MLPLLTILKYPFLRLYYILTFHFFHCYWDRASGLRLFDQIAMCISHFFCICYHISHFFYSLLFDFFSIIVGNKYYSLKMFSSLVNIQNNLIVNLICISLISSKTNHLFMFVGHVDLLFSVLLLHILWQFSYRFVSLFREFFTSCWIYFNHWTVICFENFPPKIYLSIGFANVLYFKCVYFLNVNHFYTF